MRKNLPPPDRAGFARAWKIEPSEKVRKQYIKEWGYEPAGAGPTWIVNGPYHPFWSWWYLAAVHLREIEGAPPPKISVPDASHEFLCMSLNPEPEKRPKIPDIAGLRAGKDPTKCLPGFLDPPDFVVQVAGLDDAQAASVLDAVVRHIVAGTSCDSDNRRYWENSIKGTAQHYREGVHIAGIDEQSDHEPSPDAQ